ncbi:serine/threonine-protein kinase pelle [Euwallacea fornicatus]|uniref:serine/threonine-protein kinase pelle n=1 Tax=Euwallacea fornicatus TaxID=995702 RepID=UPI00338F8101
MPNLNGEMYIHELPYDEKTQLCLLLDEDNKWELLGQRMKFNEITLSTIRKKVLKGVSPSGELLTIWENFNHTINELFILMYQMGLKNELSILKPFIIERLRILIKEDNIVNQVHRLALADSKIASDNFNKPEMKRINKMVNVEQTRDDNITLANPVKDNIKPNMALNNLNPAVQPQTPSQKESSNIMSACAGGVPHIPYQELELATDGWNKLRILGQGGFGTVYKGSWKLTQVAIKRLEIRETSRKDSNEPIRQSITEMHCLNAYRHDNILPLYGYSFGGQHPCLVYQYMSGGSLDSRIRPRDTSRILNWPVRLKIAVGAARGLQFLHTTFHNNKPLIHGDIKSANILLDPNDEPRIGDFGLAREGPERHYTHIQVTKIHGTRPYLPEEFLRSRQFSTKIDTYSFGVVLFELATARPPTGDNRVFLKDFVLNFPQENLLQLKDPKVEGGQGIFSEFIAIGKMCVQKRARERPDMMNVLLLLEGVGNVNVT